MSDRRSRVLFAWENPNVPVDEVVNDVLRAFHHPALRNESIQIQRDMFKTVKKWADEHPRRHQLDQVLNSESVKKGKNHVLGQHNKSGGGGGGHGAGGHSHGPWESLSQLGHGKVAGSLWSQVRTRDLGSMEGRDGDASANYVSSSPAPPSGQGHAKPNYDYGQTTSPQGAASSYYQQDTASYSGPASQPSQYYGGGGGGGNYGQPPQPGPAQGYGGPPPGGQWAPSGPPPPQNYGGPAYGGSAAYGGPPPQQYPPYQQGPPPPQQPPSWDSYPGQRRGY